MYIYIIDNTHAAGVHFSQVKLKTQNNRNLEFESIRISVISRRSWVHVARVTTSSSSLLLVRVVRGWSSWHCPIHL